MRVVTTAFAPNKFFKHSITRNVERNVFDFDRSSLRFSLLIVSLALSAFKTNSNSTMANNAGRAGGGGGGANGQMNEHVEFTVKV
jgi:hypothetical protein